MNIPEFSLAVESDIPLRRAVCMSGVRTVHATQQSTVHIQRQSHQTAQSLSFLDQCPLTLAYRMLPVCRS